MAKKERPGQGGDEQTADVSAATAANREPNVEYLEFVEKVGGMIGSEIDRLLYTAIPSIPRGELGSGEIEADGRRFTVYVQRPMQTEPSLNLEALHLDYRDPRNLDFRRQTDANNRKVLTLSVRAAVPHGSVEIDYRGRRRHDRQTTLSYCTSQGNEVLLDPFQPPTVEQRQGIISILRRHGLSETPSTIPVRRLKWSPSGVQPAR